MSDLGRLKRVLDRVGNSPVNSDNPNDLIAMTEEALARLITFRGDEWPSEKMGEVIVVAAALVKQLEDWLGFVPTEILRIVAESMENSLSVLDMKETKH